MADGGARLSPRPNPSDRNQPRWGSPITPVGSQIARSRATEMQRPEINPGGVLRFRALWRDPGWRSSTQMPGHSPSSSKPRTPHPGSSWYPLPMQQGWFRVGSIRGAPVTVHWSLPLAVVLTFFVLPLWAAVVSMILAHECGHAAFVRQCRLEVTGIELHAFGGRCRYAGHATPFQRAVIAWGGIAGQAALVALVLVAWFALPGLHGQVAEDILTIVIGVNVVVAAVNLVPVGQLDGREAWSLVRHLSRRAGRTQLEARAADIQRQLDALQDDAGAPKPHDLH
jgi:stage IV sporulation protein FB